MRRPLGIAIVGGLIVSQALTLYTTPVVYLYLDSFGEWVAAALARAAGAHLRRGAEERAAAGRRDARGSLKDRERIAKQGQGLADASAAAAWRRRAWTFRST